MMVLVRAVAVQSIMGVVLKAVFCLNVQRAMALIFAENVKNFHVKKYINCLKKKYIVSG